MRVKLWEIADPLVSESPPNQPHDSHIRLLQAIDDFTSQSGTSQMSRSLPPATNGNGELSCTARQAIDLEISDLLSPKLLETAEQLVFVLISETSPVHLCQAVGNRRSAYFRIAAESQSNHSHITPGSHPNHSRITFRITATSQGQNRVTAT